MCAVAAVLGQYLHFHKRIRSVLWSVGSGSAGLTVLYCSGGFRWAPWKSQTCLKAKSVSALAPALDPCRLPPLLLRRNNTQGKKQQARHQGDESLTQNTTIAVISVLSTL